MSLTDQMTRADTRRLRPRGPLPAPQLTERIDAAFQELQPPAEDPIVRRNAEDDAGDQLADNDHDGLS